jgi:hypothetical protein
MPRTEAERARDKAAVAPQAARVRAQGVAVDRKLRARNKWIYQQCCKGKSMPYGSIVAELKRIAPSKGWEVIESVQGIRAAALTYAKQNQLELPPKRQDL